MSRRRKGTEGLPKGTRVYRLTDVFGCTNAPLYCCPIWHHFLRKHAGKPIEELVPLINTKGWTFDVRSKIHILAWFAGEGNRYRDTAPPDWGSPLDERDVAYMKKYLAKFCDERGLYETI